MDTLPLVAPEQVGLSAQRLDRVRKWMNGWVDSGRLAGMVAVVMRKGELAFAETCGKADVERNKPMRPDTIFRIYSMTKPLTSTAIMMLYEEGRFQLDDPISKFIPGFANPRVYAGGSRGKIKFAAGRARDQLPRPADPHVGPDLRLHGEQPGRRALPRQGRRRFRHRRHQPEAGRREARDLSAAGGSRARAWIYGVRHRRRSGCLVRGHLAAQPYQVGSTRAQVLAPLGVIDTDFHVPADKHERFAANYQAGAPNAQGQAKLELLDDLGKSRYLAPRKVNSGGGGLVSTAADYLRFCKFMLNKGELEGTRLLGRKTVELMTMNHLKGDMADMGMPRFS